ncbi:MAG: diguanylate cyclase [Lachnospiraceae bacterium]|nr:diguanylate cyclase [Lachnospiraceae bacterium]
MGYWIVVVDDEPVSLMYARTLLESEKMEISGLRSGFELLEFIEKKTPDLILLDVMMPDMDGFETFRRLRQKEKDLGRFETPVIFLTGDSDDDTEQRGLRLGASDFIHKPFNKDVLIRRISNTILNSKRIENLTEVAATDKLTGFLNQRSGVEKVSRMCETTTGVLMVLDLDSFKLVNDLFGHITGDRVLVAFADVVRRSVRADDVVCRIGGDEFVAFFGNITEETAVATLTRRFNDQFVSEAEKIMGPEHGIPIGISVGVVMIPEYGREYDKLFRYADEALYDVKQNGKHGYTIYKSDEKGIEENEDPVKAMGRITRILEERNEGNGAMIYGLEAFSGIYHFVMRFNNRYKGRALKLLFTLSIRNEVTFEDYKNSILAFGEVIKATLRRSDIILQNKSNQFFVLLPMIESPDTQRILERIFSRWEVEECKKYVDITYASEIV